MKDSIDLTPLIKEGKFDVVLDWLSFSCWRYNIEECGLSLESARKFFSNALEYEKYHFKGKTK